MTVNEAIEYIEAISQTYKGYPEELKEACEIAISAIKEIRLYKDGKLCLIPEDAYSRQCSELDAYKEIGTVEECREAVSKYRERKKPNKCKDCLFLEDRELGRNGAIIGVCQIKPQVGRRYGGSAGCRFFEKDYEESEGE